MLVRASVWGWEEWLLNGCGVSFLDNKNVLEIESGDDCITR